MFSTVFFSGCLFLIFIGGSWCFGWLLLKSAQKEKLVKIFDQVSQTLIAYKAFEHELIPQTLNGIRQTISINLDVIMHNIGNYHISFNQSWCGRSIYIAIALPLVRKLLAITISCIYMQILKMNMKNEHENKIG